jgi:tetratricopeptide (TPR) repeat protein
MEDQNYILFENYLLGSLSETEIETFENRLKDDSEFEENFNTYKELSSYLEHKFENEEASTEFQNNLKNISNNYFEKQNAPQKVIRFKPWQYAAAASVVLLMGFFMFNNFSNPVYGDYANYETISLTVRGDNNELLKTAETEFNNKNFVKAEETFKSLIELGNDNSELKFYRAITNIELNDFEVSDDLLNGLRSGNSVYKNKATWYLALSKLKQEDENSCLELLKTIPEDADDYNEAQKLIKKLD